VRLLIGKAPDRKTPSARFAQIADATVLSFVGPRLTSASRLGGQEVPTAGAAEIGAVDRLDAEVAVAGRLDFDDLRPVHDAGAVHANHVTPKTIRLLKA
jgi:hypothetical protein